EPASGTWQFSQKVVHNSLTPVAEWYGSSAALSGDFLLVGAHSARTSVDQVYPPGVAFMYERSAEGKWSLKKQLSIPANEEATGQQFGAHLALSDKYALIQAANTQEVYVYENKGSGNWSFIQKISGADYLRPNGFKPDFGVALAVDGEYIYIGAHSDDTDAHGNNPLPRAGAVYVFKNNGGSFALHQKVTEEARQAQSHFGNNIRVSGNRMIISSEDKGKGAVQVYSRGSDRTWYYSTELIPEQRETMDRFGAEIAMDESHIAIAAPNYSIYGTTHAGAVFIYEKDQKNNWVEKEVITAPHPVSSERLGKVNIDNGTVVIGVPTRMVSGNRYSGVFYATQINPTSAGSNSMENIDGLTLFPNPSIGSFKLNYVGKDEISKIQVFDQAGSEVPVQYDSAGHTVNTRDLSGGIYLIRVHMQTGEVLTREFTVASY
ncbi:MAG: T9SS type A sorting domain-containing protein, partial [Owenweeksia sp.]